MMEYGTTVYNSALYLYETRRNCTKSDRRIFQRLAKAVQICSHSKNITTHDQLNVFSRNTEVRDEPHACAWRYACAQKIRVAAVNSNRRLHRATYSNSPHGKGKKQRLKAQLAILLRCKGRLLFPGVTRIRKVTARPESDL